MDMHGQKICLSMIVKNEASVITRCLAAILPLIDFWVIVDTGSTDGTQDLIKDFMSSIPGHLYERPWKDFAHNRTEALELARPHGDYSLIIDADDTIEIDAGFVLPKLDADAYELAIERPLLHCYRKQILRSDKPWRYRGVLHEMLTCDGAGAATRLEGVRIRCGHDGVRSRDPKVHRADIAVLERALETEQEPFLRSRYTFYLAQSYRDCGEEGKALETYLKRAELGEDVEEIFVSLYNAAKLTEDMQWPFDDVMSCYLHACDTLPSRAEAFHGASRLCRKAGKYQEGFEIAKRGRGLTEPPDSLFVEAWIYDYGLLDELSTNAYLAGHYRDSLDACLRIFAGGKLPEIHHARITAEARSAFERLPYEPNLGSLGAQSLADQHALQPARNLRSQIDTTPRVLLSILATQEDKVLPLYLECIEALDYPKSSIVLYIRTNNNADRVEYMLREWVERVRTQYARVEFEVSDTKQPVKVNGASEQSPARLRELGHIRNVSLRKTMQHDCNFYFVCDTNNLIRACTLRELVSLNLPIAAPMLRAAGKSISYSNFHAEITSDGYYEDCDQFFWVVERRIRGIFEVPVVYGTYLIRSDVIGELNYLDSTDRDEYVVFSCAARKAGIPQYFDNRQVYGYITFEDDSEAARKYIGSMMRQIVVARRELEKPI
jgi:glycosyltransferase involved in cell wall biosynthesis